MFSVSLDPVTVMSMGLMALASWNPNPFSNEPPKALMMNVPFTLSTKLLVLVVILKLSLCQTYLLVEVP